MKTAEEIVNNYLIETTGETQSGLPLFTRNDCYKLMRIYASLKEDKWISVETPPKTREDVFITDGERIGIGDYNPRRSSIEKDKWATLGFNFIEATHWLPKSALPSPPKTENK